MAALQPPNTATNTAAAWENAAADALLRLVDTADVTGTVLVAGAGEASFANRVLAEVSGARRVLFVDQDAERLDRVRSNKVGEVSTFFNHQPTRELNFAEDVFEAAFAFRGVHTAADAQNMLASLTRVVAPDGRIAIAGFGPRSAPAMRECISEAAFAGETEALQQAHTDFNDRLVTEDDLRQAAELVSLDVVASGTASVDVKWTVSSEGALEPILADLMNVWRDVDVGTRPVGTTVADAIVRARTYYGDTSVDDTFEMVWLVARVTLEDSVAIDDADVVAEL